MLENLRRIPVALERAAGGDLFIPEGTNLVEDAPLHGPLLDVQSILGEKGNLTGSEVESDPLAAILQRVRVDCPHDRASRRHEVDFEELTLRLRSYLPEEKVSYEQFQSEHGPGKCDCCTC